MFAKRNLRAALMAPLLVSLILGSVESALASNTSTSRTTIRDAVVSTRITAHQVTFKVDGSTRQLSTNARTVGEAMKEAEPSSTGHSHQGDADDQEGQDCGSGRKD